MSIKSAYRRQRGISMVELVMFIVIVSVALAGVIKVITQTTVRSVDPQIRKQALSIAEGLMEEVSLARFTYCDPTDSQADSATSAVVGAVGVGCTDAAHIENFGQEAVAGAVGRPYDNVNDYVSASGVPVTYSTDVTGAALPTGYVATITITPDAGLGPAGQQISSNTTPATMEVLRITVTVTYAANNETVTLDGYRTRYAPRTMP